MTSARIFFQGGLISFRAQFNWLNPWIFVPILVVQPLAQILLFAYVGRAADVQDDQFFLIGNALNYAVMPCLVAMGMTIAGEKWGQTLELVLATPAPRLPLFLGRAIPVIVNGWFVAIFALLVGSLLLGVEIDASAWPLIGLAAATTSLSCTGLGLAMGAVALRVRDMSTLSNVLFLSLLIFTGTNVPVDSMPDWMRTVSSRLPLTHGIEAARAAGGGAGLDGVFGLLLTETTIGLVYVSVGFGLLRWFEHRARLGASLHQM